MTKSTLLVLASFLTLAGCDDASPDTAGPSEFRGFDSGDFNLNFEVFRVKEGFEVFLPELGCEEGTDSRTRTETRNTKTNPQTGATECHSFVCWEIFKCDNGVWLNESYCEDSYTVEIGPCEEFEA